MSDWIINAGFSFLGAALSVGGGVFAFHYQWQRQARYSFYVAMCDLGCRAIEAAKKGEGAAFHRATLDEVRKHVITLAALLWINGDRLIGLWIEYSRLKPSELESQSSITRMATTAVGDLPPTKASRVLEIHFSRFVRIVRKDFIGFEPETETDPLHPDYKKPKSN